MIESASPFNGLCAVGFLARASYALARTPVLALFAASLGAGPEAIGFAVAISTITGIFGVLIGIWGGADFRAPFAIIAGLLIIAALLFRGYIGGGRRPQGGTHGSPPTEIV